MAAGTSARVRLLHMRDEIESLSRELAGLGFETYRESYALRRITERAIQIVSEAARGPFLKNCGRVIPTRLGPTSSASAIRYGMNIIVSTIRSCGKPPPPTGQSCNRSSSACLPNLKAEHCYERRYSQLTETSRCACARASAKPSRTEQIQQSQQIVELRMWRRCRS